MAKRWGETCVAWQHVETRLNVRRKTSNMAQNIPNISSLISKIVYELPLLGEEVLDLRLPRERLDTGREGSRVPPRREVVHKDADRGGQKRLGA